LKLEDEPRHALSEEVTGDESSLEGRSIEHRPARERPGSRVAAIILAFALSAGSLAGLWLGFRAGPVDRGGGEAARAEPVNLQPRVSAVVPVGPYPADVAVGEGGVWVTVPAQRPEQDNLVVRIDPVTSEVMAPIPVDGYVEAIVAGEGGVWGGGVRFGGGEFSPFVVRIDPATNEVVARIPDVSGPLAVGVGALWAVDRAGARAGPEGSTLLRIDPATNQVVARIPLEVAAWDVEFGEGYVWVVPWEPDPGEGDIVQVDPATNEVAARIEVPLPDTGYPPTVYAPALGESSAWVPLCCPNDDLMLVRIDVETGQVVGEPIALPGGTPFAVVAGHVWLVEERGALYGLNVATLEVDEAVSGFDWPAFGGSTELDPDRLTVWVTNSDQDSVTRIDLAAPTSEGGPLLEAEGTSFLLPEGWDGRADSLPGYTHRIFQAATFALPRLVIIEATDARSQIGPGDVLIVLEEFTALCPSCPSESSGLPVVLGQEDFEDPTRVPEWLPPLADVPKDHTLARRIFNIGPRYFDLRVEFGTAPVTQEALDKVNTVLASLTIGEWVTEPNDICQWHELGMLDPDCPQPNWLREVLAVAGFRVVEERGVFAVRSGDVEFFVWVEEVDEVSEERLAFLEDLDAFPVRETVRDVTVFGNTQEWDWSTDEVHVYVQQGPHGYSNLPTIGELAPIVEASLDVPYPPEAP